MEPKASRTLSKDAIYVTGAKADQPITLSDSGELSGYAAVFNLLRIQREVSPLRRAYLVSSAILWMSSFFMIFWR